MLLLPDLTLLSSPASHDFERLLALGALWEVETAQKRLFFGATAPPWFCLQNDALGCSKGWKCPNPGMMPFVLFGMFTSQSHCRSIAEAAIQEIKEKEEIGA